MAESHEYRHRFFAGNFTFLGILVAILLVVYFLSGHLNKWKLDLTGDRVYTVSAATKKILGNLKDKITVTYYSSAELPAGLQNLRRDTKDLFEEFYDLSGGKFQYSIVNPEDKAAEHAEERVEEYLRQREEHEKGARKDPPKEPAPPQSIEDIFGGRRQKTDEELRDERQKTANAIAQQTNRKKEVVERDLLRDAYKHNFFRELELRGISAFPVTERQASSVRQVRVFSAIEIRYLSKEPEVIPIHYSIENLEYELASRILKLTQTEKPVVAFFDGRKPPMPKFDPMNPVQPPPSDYEAIINHLGQLYDIRSIDLKENDSLDDLVKRLKEDARRKAAKGEEPKESEEDKVVKPEDYRLLKVFVVAQPDQLEPRQVYEVNRAASLGIPTIFLVSAYSLDVSEGGIQQGLPLRLLYPGLDDVFRKWGVELRKDLLASNSAGSVLLPRSVGPRGGLRILVEAPLPVNVASEGPGAIDQQSPLTNRIQELVFPATTGLRLLTETLAANKLEHTVLAKTTRETWSVEIDPFRQSPFQRGRLVGPTVAQYQEELAKMKPGEFRDFVEPVPLAVHLTGKLPFTFQGETIPEWRKETKKEDENKDSSLLLDAEDPSEPGGGEAP
ncbi:MAG: GldG family protein [Planctomycetota bacterium]